MASPNPPARTRSLIYNAQTTEQESVNASWQEFAREIEALGDLGEDAPFNRDEQTAAEGYRHLARFLSTMIATETDRNHPEYPRFTRFPNSVAQIGWNDPDNPYPSFFVRGDHEYVLRGNLARFDLLTISVYSGMLGYMAKQLGFKLWQIDRITAPGCALHWHVNRCSCVPASAGPAPVSRDPLAARGPRPPAPLAP
ncbi:MAG: hypothetical protein JRG95_18800 [Deltaproteobacteria bacterium]|nr:hypothetical protein [Deltaproteobacteria bacterium]